MKRATRIGFALFAAIAAFAAGAARTHAQDVDREYADVIRAIDDDGGVRKIEKVKVTSATYEKVVYDLRGRAGTERDGSNVESIDWGDSPRVYLEGLKALDNQQYEQAASDFAGAKNAVSVGKAREWLLEYAAVGRARALFALSTSDPSRLTDAIEEYQEALKANPKSLLFDQIQVGLSRCYSRAGKWSEAKQAAQALVDIGKQIKQPIWLCTGQKAVAEVLLAQGEPQDAANAYQDLVLDAQREIQWAKNDRRKSELAALEIAGAVEQGWAKVARAENTKSSVDWSGAKSYFEALGSRYPGDDAVAAAVLNGVGRCILESDPRGAVLKFAEAEVVHFTAKNEVARALYLKARAYEKMASEAGAGGSRYREMAEEALSELREMFPESVWARK